MGGFRAFSAAREGWHARCVRLVLGAGLVALAVWGASPHGTLLKSHAFSPQASEPNPNLGWALSRLVRPEWEAFMVMLRCDTPQVATRAQLDWPRAGRLTCWVAMPRSATTDMQLALCGPDGEQRLMSDSGAIVHDLLLGWHAYHSADTVLPGTYALVVRTGPDAGIGNPAYFGEVLVREYGAPRPPLRGLHLVWRILRTIGLGFLALALLPRSLLCSRPWLRVLFAVALASFIDTYLPTACWSWSDDDWHMLADQSGLLEGDLRALLESHNGHILPAYRLLWQACYAIGGLSGFAMRLLNAVAIVGTAFVLHALLRRWTRSPFAATFAAALFVTNNTLHDQSLTIIAANNFSWAANVLVVAMYCLDRFLRSHAGRWLALTALSAFVAPLMCGAGIVVFPALLLQYLLLSPRRSLRWRQRGALGGALLLALATIAGLYLVGEPPPPGMPPSWPQNTGDVLRVAERCWQALLFVLESYWPGHEFQGGPGLLLLVLASVSLLLPAARRRHRVAVLTGFATAALGYLVIFAVRQHPSVFLSHYHVVAYVGVMIMSAGAVAAYDRIRSLRLPLRLFVALAVALIIIRGIHVTERTYPIWGHLYGRQDALVRAVAEPLRGALPSEIPLFLSPDRICWLTASTRIDISHLVALIEQRRFGDTVRQQPHPAARLELPLLREIYLRLGAEYFDGLCPPQGSGTVLVSAASTPSPTDGFFRIRSQAGTGGACFGRLVLPYDLDRVKGSWLAWLTHETIVDIFSETGGTLQVRAELSPGPSNPRPKRSITLSCGGQVAHWHLDDPGAQTRTATFDVPAGTSTLTLKVAERRTAKVQAAVDERNMMLGLWELELLVAGERD